MNSLSAFARIQLGQFPTPLETMPRLSDELGGPRLLVKRDDNTGLATGGNKTRKLEFLMADAMAQDADMVITQGAVQSNHVRQTAAAAAKLGMACHVLLEERLEGAPGVYNSSGNVFLDRLFGATITTVPGGSDMPALLAESTEEQRRNGRRPYAIPGGGSNPLGALGYAACLQEILAEAEESGVTIDHIVTATGSAGTQAGLVAAMSQTGAAIPIHGISVRFDKEIQEERVFKLACETAELMGTKLPERSEVIAFDDYVGAGYGHPTDAMIEALTLAARCEGLLLDPVYSGKAMAGLIDLIRTGRFGEDETVVFIHTGGSASLFAYEWAFALG